MWSEEGMLTCGQRACDIGRGRGAPKMGMGAPSARVILKHRDGETIFRATSVVRLILRLIGGAIPLRPVQYQRNSDPPYRIPIQVFLSQRKHNVSPTAKKIIFQLLGEKTPSQKFLKN